MTFVRVFKELYTAFEIHALDIFGIGYSSRGKFKDTFTYEETRDYFIDAMQEWRKAVGLEYFTLVGHSFGGYLTACYAEKYPEKIRRLVLLSPVGASEKTK